MGKVLSGPALLGGVFQPCPSSAVPTLAAAPAVAVPPTTTTPPLHPGLAVTLDLGVSCDRYFCCVCFLMS